jgi:hypothetical protein
MTSNIRVAGVDLDSIFAAYASGTKADVTGYTVAGVDLKDRFAKYVSGTKAAVTGYTVGGVDLKDIFAPSGGAAPPVSPQFDGGSFYWSRANSHDSFAGIAFELLNDGTYAFTKSGGSSGYVAGDRPNPGNWHHSPAVGVGSGFEARFYGTRDVIDATGSTSVAYDTGWQAISGFVISGSATASTGSGGVDYAQDYFTGTLQIRAVGGSVSVDSAIEFGADASAF